MRTAALFSIVWMFFPCLLWAEKVDTESVLKELDAAIAEKETYRERKETAIIGLKKRLQHASSEQEKYALCNALFYEYLHYQTDSAMLCLNRLTEMPLLPGHPDQETEIAINRAEVMGVMGMYSEAIQELEKIDSRKLSDKTQEKYFLACRSCYGWLADYTVEGPIKDAYLKKTDLYRDSICAAVSGMIDRDIACAEKQILRDEPDKAIPLLKKHINESQDMELLSYLNYTLYEAYHAKGDRESEIYYLAHTVLCDIKRMVREYASLHKLAWLMYQEGNISRAYSYLSCAMEDAVSCNARLRSLEVAEFYPIIDRAYREKMETQRTVVHSMLWGISVLAILLIIAVCYLYYWMKKLTVMRHNLYVANCKLETSNAKLAQTGKIKEVYIARYLDKCVGYLGKLEQYRRSLEKLAMASKVEELFKTIRSDQFLRDERKAFYSEFDKSFLDLFPNFIEDFNKLLTEEGRIYPKSGELLNTELRIFALIRLGVTDANRIAHFLSYSLATVYNYRSKIRNKAAGDKDKFEQEVMSL